MPCLPPPPPLPRQLARDAFTLIELLTVITIIGILAAIIIPVTGKVRESARRANCVSNLRQTGIVIQLYAQDHKDSLPGPLRGTYGPYPVGNSQIFIDKVQSYLTNQQVLIKDQLKITIFECPAWAGIIPPDKQRNLGASGNGGNCYALEWNYHIIPGDASSAVRPFGYPDGADKSEPLRFGQIERPSRSPAIFDLDAMERKSYKGDEGVAQKPVHGDIRNTLYFDGHVAAVNVNN
jgi:prepilin-type N-terminal cleavage/methylation domain-containing protein/prepilin-type processing-associated H-X9-DG protein